MKQKIIFSLILLALLGGFFVWQNNNTKPITVDLPTAQDYQDFATSTTTDTEDEVEIVELIPDEQIESEVVEPESINKNINLNVPFTSQAPLADWSQPWQDACEEASVMMVDYYYQNKNLPSKEQVSDILKEMVDWQEENWSAHYNLSTAKLAEYVKITLNYQTEIVEDLNAEKLKFYLDKGQPIIIPADGKKLANPNFQNGGPDYHMLVVKGYVGNNFITNDPGTRLGADFIYSAENLLESIADWNQKESQTTGPKNGLIIFP